MIVPIILCGGAGTRLWPISRKQYPKQFLKLTDEQTLLQKTFLRIAELSHIKDIIVITHECLFFQTQQQLKNLPRSDQKIHYILEPASRNTAAAIAVAATYCKQHFDQNVTLLILPIDHLITNTAVFYQAINYAQQLAAQNYIVTFGIKPTHLECNYGYIEKAEVLPSETEQMQTFLAKRFVEKPTLEDAIKYLQNEKFVWNSGIFCFTTNTAYEAFKEYAPQILQLAEKCLSHTSVVEQILHLAPQIFNTINSVSFDYAVMEYFKPIAIIESDMGWCDIGSWDAIAKLATTDAQGNHIQGEVFLQNTTDCYVRADKRFVGLIGVEKLVVIDTDDALLVSHIDEVQQVKNIVTHLKKNESKIITEHTTIYRHWGNYTILEEFINFKIKRIAVNPSAALSLQMHRYRNENWVVVKGVAQVTNGEEISILKANESVYIPMGNKHRLENIGNEVLIIIEVQTGTYLGEDDIVRFDDVHTRSPQIQA